MTIVDVKTGKIVRTPKFSFEVNEMSWNKRGDLFYLTTGSGALEVLLLLLQVKMMVFGVMVIVVWSQWHLCLSQMTGAVGVVRETDSYVCVSVALLGVQLSRFQADAVAAGTHLQLLLHRRGSARAVRGT